MKFCRVGDLTLHYADEGPRKPDAVVFINSLGSDLRIWDEVAPAIAKHHRVIRYDKRGHGLSSVGPGEARMDDFVADLAGLLNALGVEKVTLVGLSIGGIIAQLFHARHPDRLLSLVLCGTAHRIGSAEGWAGRIETVRAEGIAAVADVTMERWFTANFRASRPAELEGCRNMLTRTPLKGYIAGCAALRDADLSEAAKAITVPTTCIVGRDDSSTPVDLVRSLADLVRGSAFHVVDQAAHIPCVEQPEIMVRLIEQHLHEAARG
ncbi:3-oxoadipate enol-lactonase [Chelatococcus sp. GCM10030263]|uniref:3-oxoadipate enol-lactonase n=1 Tax=Chelatococcus sp. GCM10030263 TaxID=3273387 RepID=UPI00360E2896